MKRASSLVVALAAALFVLPIGAAHASCAEPIPLPQALDEARFVFVGTVTGLAWQDRVATVDVEEVWKGDFGATVTVNGGSPISVLEEARAEGQELWTSVDRTYVAGERYLFVSHSVDEGAFNDNQCSATQPFSGDLEALRPPDARTVEAGGGGSNWPWAAAAGLVIAGGAGLMVWLIRRARPSRPAPTPDPAP